jgi:hypothetical protein
VLLALSALNLQLSATPLGGAFTYQGRLSDGTNAANGLYDFRFTIHDAPAGGYVLAGPLTNSAASVSNGLFTVALDFGASVFNGDARWLEVGVRASGSAATFTMLAPRQALTSVPYALKALSVGGAGLALSISQQPSASQVSVSDDLLINATNSGSGTWTAKRATVDSVIAGAMPMIQAQLSGTLLNPASLSAASSNAAIAFGSTNRPTDAYKTISAITIGTNASYGGAGGDALFPDFGGPRWQSGAGMFDWHEHGWLGTPGASQPLNELQIMANWRGCLAAYMPYTFYPDNGLGPGFQMGGSGHFGDSFWFQYNTAPGYAGLGYSKLVSFITSSGSSNTTGYASLRGVATAYNTDQAAIRFYAGPRHALDNSPVGDGIELGGTTGNGWELRGPLIQEQRRTSGDANCGLDFAAAYCVTMTAPASSMTFFTTNRTSATTNYEHRVFVIRSGPELITATWPAWSWLTSVPTGLGPAQVLRLSLESIGPGETNVLASAAVGNDPTAAAYDADAVGFFGRASITNLRQKGAINDFVVALKTHNLWTNLHAAYPFVGGTSTAHAINLLSGNYTIDWHGTVTHDANGITGDAASGYGDTGYNPAVMQTTNSASFYVFQRLAVPAPTTNGGTGCYLGNGGGAGSGSTGWNELASQVYSGTCVACFMGPNTRSNPNAYPFLGVVTPGHVMMYRTNSTTCMVYRADLRAWSYETGLDVSSDLSTNMITLLANNGRGGGGVTDFSGANLGFAAIGLGMTAQQADDFLNAVAALESGLGR